jgi:glucose-6-phosphate 1-epimerase
MDIAILNKTFGITGQLEFTTGKGGFVFANINNKYASACVSLYAAQVLTYRPLAMADDLLFLSERAYFVEGKAIKGGVPICWPWFGPDPKGLSRPAHGFARNSLWTLLEACATPSGGTRLRFGLRLNEKTRGLWQGDIEAQLEIEIGETLSLRLETRNNGPDTIELTQALHTYFKVGDIAKTTVSGLANKNYLDKVDGGREKRQAGEVRIAGEVDRIYQDVSNDLRINDAALKRAIHIQSSGSHSAVVWNPWKDICAGMADLDDNDYQHMLCVETANAGDDVVIIKAGDSYSMTAKYHVTPA